MFQRFLILLLCLVVAGCGFIFTTNSSQSLYPSLVQSAHFPETGPGGVTTVAQAFSQNIAAGNLVVVWVTWGDSAVKPSSVLDNEGNTYTEIPNTYPADLGNSQWSNMYYKENISCTGPCGPALITATWAVGIGYRAISISEFSGIHTAGALDQSTSQFQAATLAPTSTSVTPTTNCQIVVGATGRTDALGGTLTIESLPVTSDPPVPAALQYELKLISGPVASDFVSSLAANYITSVATFKGSCLYP